MKVKRLVEIEQTRPADATPERLRKLKASGMKVSEMVKLYGVSAARIYQLLNQR